MKVKIIIKYVAVFLVSLVISVLLHTGIFSGIKLGVVSPNIPLLVTASFGFMYGSNLGMAFGFTSGLVMDCLAGDYFGMYTLLYLTIGFINGFFKRLYYGDDIRLPMLLVGVSDFLFGMFMYLALFITMNKTNFTFYFYNIIMPEAVYTVVVFILLYRPMLWAYRWLSEDSGRRVLQ